MGYVTRAALTAVAVTVLVGAGVAAALGATTSGPRPSVAVGSVPRDGSQARVGNVSCGQTLTESTVVENDRVNGVADALVAVEGAVTSWSTFQLAQRGAPSVGFDSGGMRSIGRSVGLTTGAADDAGMRAI
jgi:hypothetical protein